MKPQPASTSSNRSSNLNCTGKHERTDIENGTMGFTLCQVIFAKSAGKAQLLSEFTLTKQHDPNIEEWIDSGMSPTGT
jgi:hypothetical protein